MREKIGLQSRLQNVVCGLTHDVGGQSEGRHDGGGRRGSHLERSKDTDPRQTQFLLSFERLRHRHSTSFAKFSRRTLLSLGVCLLLSLDAKTGFDSSLNRAENDSSPRGINRFAAVTGWLNPFRVSTGLTASLDFPIEFLR